MNERIESTIKAFFQSVYGYISENSKLYTKVADLQAIDAQGEIIKDQERQIMYMIIEKQKDCDAYKLREMQFNITTVNFPGFQAFVKPNSVDNSALVAYRDVINGITEYIYYGLREEVFLKPLKQWYYVISNRPMKDLVYPFLPLNHFMVKDSKQRG